MQRELPKRIEQGSRTKELTEAAVRWYKEGVTATNLETSLMMVNQSRCVPPLTNAEVWAIYNQVIADFKKPDSPLSANPISETEWNIAKASPRAIVEGYLYADVAQLAAPGGTGKTTLILYELIHIVLGLTLWGMKVSSPGTVLFVTKEDPREQTIARIRHICEELNLSDEQIEKVRESLLILDMTGSFDRLVRTTGGSIEIADLPDAIIENYKDFSLAMIVFDPMVQFGASENALNDNENALVQAARRLVRRLGCCVRFVHHTGQAVARERILDMYSGRGGSALADGCRMVSVIQRWERGGKYDLPAGCKSDKDGDILIMARPKVQYAPPGLPMLFIKRKGFGYECFVETPMSPEAIAEAHKSQLLRYLVSKWKDGIKFSRTGIELQHEHMEMGRNEVRAAREMLLAEGLLAEDMEPTRGKPRAILIPYGCD